MAGRNAQEMISFLKDEKSNLELVNSDLLRRLEQKEYDLINVKSVLQDVKSDSTEKEKSIDKAQKVIKKLNDECEKAMKDLQVSEEKVDNYQLENKNLNRELVDMQIQCQENDKLNKTQGRLRTEIQKFKDDYNKLAQEKENILISKNEEIDRLKNDKDQLEEIIQNLDTKLDEIAKQNELRDRLLEESIEKGKELEEILQKKEEEVHRLVRDFEEEQSEKENQIHHLKATATNTIRNLYALNGLTGENISNNIEAQQLKRSISGHTLDLKPRDPKKKVSFGGSKARFASTLSRPGDRNDINETIDVSGSQKLLSPHRKRTAAYTQATNKSAMKNRGRDSTTLSARKDRETTIAPLDPSTPAKFTTAKRSSYDDDFMREDNFDEFERSVYGVPNTIGQIESNSALVMQLKNLLENALDREKHLADFIKKLCNEDLTYLAKKFENLKRADMKIRENSESLLMRNEELETRLLASQGKLWTLKLMYDDYDEIINNMSIQKEENTYIHKEKKSEVMSAVDNFLGLHNLKRKKTMSKRSKSALGSQKSKGSLKKKQSVRFQGTLGGRSRGGDQFSDMNVSKAKTALLRKNSSRSNGIRLKNNRSEAVPMPGIGVEPRGPNASRGNTNRGSNLQSQRSGRLQSQRSANLQSQRSANLQAQRNANLQAQRSANLRSQNSAGIGSNIGNQRNAGIGGNTPSQRNPGVGGNNLDPRSAGQPNFYDQRSGGNQSNLYDQRSGGNNPTYQDQRSSGNHPGSQNQRSGGNQSNLYDQRSGGNQSNLQDQRSGGNNPTYQDQRSSGNHPGSQNQRSGGNQTDLQDQRISGIHPNLQDQRSPSARSNNPSQHNTAIGMNQPPHRSASIQPNIRQNNTIGGGQSRDPRSPAMQHDFEGEYDNEGFHANVGDQTEEGVQLSFGPRQTSDNQMVDRSHQQLPGGDHIISGERNMNHLNLPHLESRAGPHRSMDNLTNQDRMDNSRMNDGLSPAVRFRDRDFPQPGRRDNFNSTPEGENYNDGGQDEYDPMDDPLYDPMNDNYEDGYNDPLGDIHEEYYDEDEYSEGEGEGEESEDSDNIDAKSIFDEANNYIEELKTQLKEGEDNNEANEQNIDSLNKEVDEVKTINDRLESQLYKYQYDINRVTDVLMNDAYPNEAELQEEENNVQDMSEQEKHLYLLLKKAATLRTHMTDASERLKVYEKDVEELASKNRHLQEVDEVKNQITANLDEEKRRANELETLVDEKQQAFHAVLEEKEALLDNLNKVQAEKDELKGTLDTLHQLRDQEEEEIEKTLDEAKSIIQKLEEKLHAKDEKIKKYKEKLSNCELDKSQLEKQISNVEDEFKDKEKNMKLKLLWAQMEKKDLATTIMKLENSTQHVPQSEIKEKDYSRCYDQSIDMKCKSSYSEERVRSNRHLPHHADHKRNSEQLYNRECCDDERSGSIKRVSLRRRNIEVDCSNMHERSKSAIS